MKNGSRRNERRGTMKANRKCDELERSGWKRVNEHDPEFEDEYAEWEDCAHILVKGNRMVMVYTDGSTDYAERM